MLIAVLVVGFLADTVRVRGGDAMALRRALAQAPAGSVVLVGPGRYAGPVVVDRPLILAGEGHPRLTAEGVGTVVRITAPGVVVRGLRIENSGRDRDRDDAGVRVEADGATLESLTITDVHHGVYLQAARHAVIRRVTIAGRAADRPNDRGDGIHFYRSSHALADGVDIADVRDGMYFAYTDSAAVRRSRVTRTRYGLHYMFSHDNLFEANAFTYSAAGSSIMNSRGVVARGNLFAFHRGVGGYGLLQQTTEGTVLERNRFVGNAVGLFLDGAADAVIRDNLVADNHVGLQLFPSTVRATITGNAIVANSLTAAGAAPDSRFCAGERGNYWSDDDGWDLDRDGVHDVAYEAVSPLTVLSQHRPALRLFLASPAATVLAWAERALPVFDVTGVRDACPLARLPDGVPTLGADLPAAARRAGEAYAVAGAALGAGLLLAGLGTRRKENE